MGNMNIFKMKHIKINTITTPLEFDLTRWMLLKEKDNRFISTDRKALRDTHSHPKWCIENLNTKEVKFLFKTGDYKSDMRNIKSTILSMSDIANKKLKRIKQSNTYQKYGFTWNHGDKDLIKTVSTYFKTLRYQDAKKPLIESRYIGLELEFGSKHNIETIAEVFANNRMDKFIQFKRDGSVNLGSGSNPIELAVLLHESHLNKIEKICKLIHDLSGRVNHTCGMHVHIDMRNRDQNEVANRFLNMENILFNMMPQERRTNQFCKRNSEYTREQMFNDRRMFLNLSAFKTHSTYEIRLHEGCLDAPRIINWVKLLIAIANTKQSNNNLFKSFDEMASSVDYGEELMTYIKTETERNK